MPPFNDIYIVTSERNEVCIGKFLSKYADLTADKIRNDFEVYNNDEWVKTGTLAATVAYGLMDNQRSFAMYFDSVVSSLKSVILFFTPDNRLVFGMSIEYEEDNEEAERVLLILKEEFGTTIGGISCETPPGEAYEWLTKNES